MHPDAEEVAKIQTSFRIVAVIALLTLGTGVVFYHFVENLSWLNSLYFCTVTLTTVGYGDITPKTDLGKLFTVFYILGGIGIIATFANLFLKNAVIRRSYKKETEKSKGKLL